jgi:hypothetical protein
MINKFVLTGIAALVMSASCAHNPVRINNKLRDTCFNLLFDTRKTAIQKDDDKRIIGLFQDYWCSDYDKIEEDITKLSSYLIK